MSKLPNFTHGLVLPRLWVQNANAISSPMTHGFPSITAFMGFMWALGRRLHQNGIQDVFFEAVGVVCHDFQELTGGNGFRKAFRLTRNPLTKSGATAPIIEEGRIHLDISIVFGVTCERWRTDNSETYAKDLGIIREIVSGMRCAGGSIMAHHGIGTIIPAPWIFDAPVDDEDRSYQRLRYRLMPGFALIERQDVLTSRLKYLRAISPQANLMDAWLSMCRHEWKWVPADHEGDIENGEWKSEASRDWLVPITVGYAGLLPACPAGTVEGARQSDVPFQFAEALYSIGEWISPHRLSSPTSLLWHAESDPVKGIYRCCNAA
ncbi:type I-F CRISPR-associated protein Csy2 [Acetobacter sp. AAB5]|uniref:type I-F CRISPR-associated protein Csy2 n=1 Tax=Acetobacter sp. AAB5 TaxID=3418370 RepID=UPI003CF1E5E0